MDEQGKVADPVETPSVDDAVPDETPAEPEQPAPEPERATKAELQSELTSVRAELAKVREEARESGSRAQSAADKHAARLEKRIERLSTTLEQIAALNMDEPSLRAWKAQQETEKLREQYSERDSEAASRKAQEDFQAYSAAVLAEEGISSTDPVLRSAWDRYAAGGKDISDWKAALGRAIAEVRKAEAKTAIEKAQEAEKKAREDERAKMKNEKRSNSGSVDQGVSASVSQKRIRDMTEEEFAAYDQAQTEARERRRMALIR